MDDRRTRFSLGYFVVALLVILGVQYFVSQQGAKALPYSELRDKIESGQVQRVRLSETYVEAVPLDSITKRTGDRLWTAAREGIKDDELEPLLNRKNIPYEGVARGWLGQALGWLLPILVFAALWIWMLRRMNPTQGVLTVGKNANTG